MLDNTIKHNSITPLNPQQWAETLLRKAKQDQTDRQLRYARITGKFVPNLEQI